ncbi:MAG: hypothetical protein NZL89_06215, partial [Leptospiraceae bacterium]|nr:hypothetical protein [Leptospiraceae bacterium]
AKSQQLKDAGGKVIGRYDVLSDTEARASFDLNQNGVNERVATYRDKQLVNVDYFDDASGTKTKSVSMKDGKPESVRVYEKGGSVRGEVIYDSSKNTAKEVILPGKNKKVVYNNDGTLSVSEAGR